MLKKISSFLLLLNMVTGSLVAQKVISTEQYITTYKDIAMREMKRTGIPAAIKLAQGIVESSSGNGWLVQHSNNHFGIKCKNTWHGPTITYTDDAKNECFRKYDNPEESWTDHSDFLRSNTRYAFLFQLDPTDYKAWAYGLKQAGYATSTTYSQQLIKAVEEYDLQKYTLMALGLQPEAAAQEVLLSPKRIQEEAPAPVQSSRSPNTDRAVVKTTDKKQYPVGIFEINGRKVIWVPKAASLLDIASKQEIRLSRLLAYNDLESDRPLQQDMLVYLERKGRTGAHDYHTVQAGENMHDIAQEEGIRMKWLLKRNKMEKGQQAAAGAQLYLTGFAFSPPPLGPEVIKLADGNEKREREKASPDQSAILQMATVKESSNTATGQDLAADNQYLKGAPAAADTIPEWKRKQLRENIKPDSIRTDTLPSWKRKWAEENIRPDTIAPTSGHRIPVNTQPEPPRREWPRQSIRKLTPLNDNAPPAATAAGIHYHVVRPKETLYGISKKYNVSVKQLQQWNHLQGFGIKTGQRLIISK